MNIMIGNGRKKGLKSFIDQDTVSSEETVSQS